MTTTTTTTTTTDTKTKSTKVLTSSLTMPSLLTKAITSNTTAIAVPSVSYPISPIATGSFILPIKQKNKRNNRHKHLRKPPSFDTYISYSNSSTSSTTYGYMTRTPSISSSYSSTSSLADNEDLMYGCGFNNNKSSASLSAHSPRLRRGSSAFKVRFAEDDGSSIVSSSSGGSEWDDVEIEEEEDFILIAPRPPIYDYHHKSSSE